MVKSNIHFIKSKTEDDKCSCCDTFIEQGEVCMVIYSKKGEIYHNVKIHISCIEIFIKEMRLCLREEILKKVK